MTAAPATAAMAAAAERVQTSVELVLGAAVGTLTDDQRRLLETGWRNGRRLLALIGDLQTVALAEAGRLEPEWTPVDLRELATRAAERAWPVAHATGKPLRLEADAPVPAVAAAGVLDRALTALVEQVVEQARRGEEIVVAVAPRAVEVRYAAERPVAPDSLAFALADAVCRLHGGEATAGWDDGQVEIALRIAEPEAAALAA